ncbi:unnamed protein product [Linum trigynum]|uniref:Uncharacterized protein n=1 Tax=Linum trigynum TaxID=586398 RepID=A0AAV2GJP1_9ROSI
MYPIINRAAEEAKRYLTAGVKANDPRAYRVGSGRRPKRFPDLYLAADWLEKISKSRGQAGTWFFSRYLRRPGMLPAVVLWFLPGYPQPLKPATCSFYGGFDASRAGVRAVVLPGLLYILAST